MYNSIEMMHKFIYNNNCIISIGGRDIMRSDLITIGVILKELNCFNLDSLSNRIILQKPQKIWTVFLQHLRMPASWHKIL